MNRGVRQPQPGAPVDNDPAPQAVKNNNNNNTSSASRSNPKGLRIAQVGLLACIAILVLAAAFLMATSNNKNSASVSAESRFVDTTKMQAIFLNNGQVYFGKIGDLNKDYLSLSDIYYLRVNQQVQPGQPTGQNDVSLAKLGCELHGPEDRMVVNRSQVVFWENLKTDGQVADAVTKFKDANKDGQKCQTAQAGGAAAPTSPVTPPAAAPAAPNTPANPARRP